MKPHISLAGFDEIGQEACRLQLAEFAGVHAPFAVTLSHFGVFPTEEGVVFCAPTVTMDLLRLHADFHRLFAEYHDSWGSYYRLGNWTPHCTLALNLPHDLIPKALQVCLGFSLPIDCCVREIGLVKYPPVEHVCTSAFALA